MQTSKCLKLFLIVFLPLASFAQQNLSLDEKDITGLWKGTLYNDSTRKYYRYEIGISEEKGKLSGFSHTFFLDGDKEFYGVKKVKVKKMDGKLIIEDAGLIANNYPVSPAKGVRQLNILTLASKDSMMVLSGPFSTNRTKEYSSLTGFVNLERKDDFWQSALVPHLQELGKADELSFVQQEKEQIKALITKNDEQKKVETTIINEKEDPDKKKEEPVKEEPVKPVIAMAEPAPGEAPDMFAPKAVEKPKPVEKSAIPEKPKKQEEKATVKQVKNKSEKEKTTAVNTNPSTEKLAEKKEAVIPPAAEVLNRLTVLQQTVLFKSDSLEIALYDNGEVDGDIVSVLMNGKLIMEKEKLSTKAVKKMIYPDPELESIELVMYAENLGAIAPNTGLLVVHDGKSIYEIRFSGDLQKNASIILKRKK